VHKNNISSALEEEKGKTGLHFRLCTKRKTGKKFTEALQQLHYAGSCKSVGRFLRLMLLDDSRWVGGLIIRNALPIVQCRDEFFGINQFRKSGRIPKSGSPYWDKLNRIVNMARAFIFEEFQGLGYGTKMIQLLETDAVKIWKRKYGFLPIGYDCLDNAPPEKAKIFLNNGWDFIGRTRGYSHSRCYKPGKVKSQSNPISGRMEKSSFQWYVYTKKLDY
jgi:hypothetical protein